MPTRSDLDVLSEALDSAAGAAVRDLRRALSVIDLGQPEVARNALLEAMPAITARWGDTAASAAAEWYEAMRAEAVSGAYSARLAEGLAPEHVEKTVRWAAGRLWDDRPQDLEGLLRSALTRMVVSQGKQTLTVNAVRDPARPRWARVPGPDGCCAWCTMLASRGFVYGTKAAAGGAGHDFHDHCNCVPTPLWRGGTRPAGYDPAALRDLYGRARQAAIDAGEGLHPDGATIAAQIRRLAPDAVTDGVH